MTTRIIGLAGLAGSGKDTAAQLLRTELQALGRTVDTMAFADPIRWMLAALGVPEQAMSDRGLKEQPLPEFAHTSYRHMAQTLGTEWGRQCMGVSFWTARLALRLAKLEEAGRAPDFLLITDVRFPNEAAWVKNRAGRMVKITRPGPAGVRPHISEAQVLPFDVLLDNRGTVDDLALSCRSLALQLVAEQAVEA